MKANELVKFISAGNPGNTEVVFLYGQNEVEIVHAERSEEGNSLALVLAEKRDLSDPEKHEG